MKNNHITRSPRLAPSVVFLATAVILATNPGRQQVLASLLGGPGDPVRLIPLARTAMVPTLFAKYLWGCVLGAAFWRLAAKGVFGRLLAYGIGLLVLYAVSGLVLWTTVLQWWAFSQWFSDALQGWFLLAFLVGYTWGVLCAVGFWMRDLLSRCPECLERLCMPLKSGSDCNVMIEPVEIDSICLRGHGAMKSTRWSRTFQPVTGFWKQLLR